MTQQSTSPETSKRRRRTTTTTMTAGREQNEETEDAGGETHLRRPFPLPFSLLLGSGSSEGSCRSVEGLDSSLNGSSQQGTRRGEGKRRFCGNIRGVGAEMGRRKLPRRVPGGGILVGHDARAGRTFPYTQTRGRSSAVVGRRKSAPPAKEKERSDSASRRIADGRSKVRWNSLLGRVFAPMVTGDQVV